MGICASVQYSRNRGTLMISKGSPSPAMVIHSVDGRLQEFRQPVKASNVISGDGDSNAVFLCNSENMFVNWHVPHVDGDEELQMGQIYFIMPMSKAYRPLSLQELCSLAIKASLAIERSSEMKKKKKKGKTNGVVYRQWELKTKPEGEFPAGVKGAGIMLDTWPCV